MAWGKGGRPDQAERNRANARHGLSRTKVHWAWSGMIDRCGNPNNKDYPRYGGRGIAVCDRWLVFENFLADMGQPPERSSIDRIDNGDGYSPDNCRWTTTRNQARNRRSNVLVEFNGETRTVAEWAEATGLERKTLEYRIRVGWPAEKALTTPSLIPRKAA